MKKFLLTLGSISAIAAPVVAVVSCGVANTTREQRELHNGLDKAVTYEAIQERWQEMVIADTYTGFAPDKFFGTYDTSNVFTPATIAGNKDIEDMFNMLLIEQTNRDHRYLYKTGQQIMNNKDFMPNANTAAKKQQLKDWGLLESYSPQGDITKVTAEAKKFILKHQHNIRRDVYKKMIAVLYLENANKEDVKYAVLPSTHTMSEKQNLIGDSEFALVNEAISQNLFAKWTISIKHDDANVSAEMRKFINHANDATMSDADKHFDPTTTDEVFKLVKYSEQNKKMPVGILPSTFSTDLAAYKGISSLTDIPGTNHSGADGEKKTADELKLINDKSKWLGYLSDKKILNKDIPYFAKDNHTDILFSRVQGLMPIYKQDGYKGEFEIADIATLPATGLDVAKDFAWVKLASTTTTVLGTAVTYDAAKPYVKVVPASSTTWKVATGNTEAYKDGYKGTFTKTNINDANSGIAKSGLDANKDFALYKLSAGETTITVGTTQITGVAYNAAKPFVKLVPATANTWKVEATPTYSAETTLMAANPVLAQGTLTFNGTDFETPANRRFLSFQLAKKTSVYSNAVEYFVNRKDETKRILIDIKSKDVRDRAIQRGFKFVKKHD